MTEKLASTFSTSLVFATNPSVPLSLLTTSGDIAGNGWLVVPQVVTDEEDINVFWGTEPVTLRFDLKEERDGRRFYKIYCLNPGSFQNQQIDSSRNGYLGCYGAVADDVVWQVEAKPHGGAMAITLANKNGDSVGLDGSYLGAQRPAVTLLLANYTPL